MKASFHHNTRSGLHTRGLLALLIFLFPLLLSSGAFALSDGELDAIQSGFENRRNQILQSHITSRFPTFTNSDPTTASETQVRSYPWRELNYAMAIMFLNDQSRMTVANDSVTSACVYLDRCKDSQFLPAGGQFHWVAPNLFRVYELFRPGGTAANAGCLSAANVTTIRNQAWRLVDARASFEHTETTTTRACKTWRIMDSENHHLMSNMAIWWACKTLIDGGMGNNVCNGGGTVAQYYAAYTAYLKEYLIERARRGLFIEIDSTGYGRHTLQNLYNMADFAEDPVIRARAGKLLDLYWSVWASNQVDGINGGSKARCYQHVPGVLWGDQDFGHAMSWFHGNIGTGSGNNYKEAPVTIAITSAYRLPRVTLDIILDVPGRGVYESRQRAMGLALAGFDNPPDYRMPTDFGGILRYTYGTPDFIMGSSLMAPRPENDWTAISSQNRWNGVIFRGHNHARIFPQGQSTEAGHSYNRTSNSHWTTQRKGTMIAQKLIDNRNTGRFRVWFAGAASGMTTTSFADASGWIFATAPNAYAAVRPAAGTYAWVDPDPTWERFAPDGSWYQSTGSSHDFHPVIIEVVRKSAYTSLEAFKDDIKNNPFSYNASTRFLDYTSVYGDRFQFYGDQSQLPLINGLADNLAPPKTYDTPYVHGAWESSVITVEKDGRSMVIDFDAVPSTNTVTAPFDGWLYVNRLENGLVGDGHSFATGFSTIQQAIDSWTSAVQGILVAGNTYSQSFTIGRDGVKIYGGYDAKTGARDPLAYPTIVTGSSSNHIMRAHNASSWNLDGLTIQGGIAATGSGAESSGAGLYATGSAGTLRNVVFAENRATSGGAVCLDGTSDILFKDCHFSRNSATDGGAIQMLGSAKGLFTECAFTSNTMTKNGGVIRITSAGAQAAFNRSAFFHNGGNPVTTTYGGVAEASTGKLAFTNCIFAYNRAGRGPVLSVAAGQLDMVNCTAVGNFTQLTASLPQGILRLIPPSGTTYRIINNIFENNNGTYTLKDWGAGAVLVNNNLFHPNTVGAVYDEGSPGLDVAALNAQAWASENVAGPANLRALGGAKRSGTWSAVLANQPAAGYTTLVDGAASHKPDALRGAMLSPRGNLSETCNVVISNTATAITVRGVPNAETGAGYLIMDFDLVSPSAAIDTGASEPADLIPSTDYLGLPRPQPLAKPDVGAYETNALKPTSAIGMWNSYR